MDRTVDPAAAQQRRVGGIDDGFDREGGDIGLNSMQCGWHGKSPGLRIGRTALAGVTRKTGCWIDMALT